MPEDPAISALAEDGVLAFVQADAADVAYAPLGRCFLTGAVRSVRDLPAHDFRRTSPRFADANVERNLSLLDRIVATATASA